MLFQYEYMRKLSSARVGLSLETTTVTNSIIATKPANKILHDRVSDYDLYLHR